MSICSGASFRVPYNILSFCVLVCVTEQLVDERPEVEACHLRVQDGE